MNEKIEVNCVEYDVYYEYVEADGDGVYTNTEPVHYRINRVEHKGQFVSDHSVISEIQDILDNSLDQ